MMREQLVWGVVFKMKKLLLIGLILFIPFAYGIADGDIYSQEEIMSYNLSGLTIGQFVSLLQCQQEDSGHWVYILFQWFWQKEFSCLQLDVYNKTENPYETYYILKRQSYFPNVAWNEYLDCLEEDGMTELLCQNRMTQLINIDRTLEKLIGIWIEIVKFQTIPEEQPEDIGLGGDLW